MPAIDLFGFLDGTSAWWWVAFALALGAVEVVTFTYFLLWLSFAALTVGGLLFLAPETTGTTQVLTFALSALVYTVAGWAWLRARRSGGATDGGNLNRRAAQLVGRVGVVAGPFRAGVGTIEIDGVGWRARLSGNLDRDAQPGPGSLMRVLGAEGTTLLVDIAG